MARFLRFVSQPWTPTRVGDELLAAFDGPYTDLVVSVGFANASGVRYLAEPLAAFRARGGHSQFIVGVDGSVTSAGGVRALMRLVDELWLFRNPARPLFHPKTFLFASDDEALVITGSANLTESGLWINYEDAAVIELDLTDDADQALLASLRQSFGDPAGTPNAKLADDELVQRLEEAGLLPSEAKRRQRVHREDVEQDEEAAESGVRDIFPPAATKAPPAAELLPEEARDVQTNPAPPPPLPPEPPTSTPAPPPPPQPPLPPTGSPHRVFVLRLGPRDAGTQIGFSPDVFIPLAALNADPNFWKRSSFAQHVTPDGNDYEVRYASVEFRRRNGSVEVQSRRLYYYPRRAEFRFSTSQIHADSQVGDLMRVEIAAAGLGFEYTAQVLKPGDSQFTAHDAIASNLVTNSDKRWGYA